MKMLKKEFDIDYKAYDLMFIGSFDLYIHDKPYPEYYSLIQQINLIG